MTSMEDDLNIRRPSWKMTLIEDDLSVRRPQWKMKSMEDELNCDTLMEDALNGR